MQFPLNRATTLIVFGFALTACSESPTTPTTPSATAPSPAATARSAGVDNDGGSQRHGSFEIPYMEQTIDHHAMGVMMATLCLQKAFHAELVELCRMERETQQREIQELQSWLQEWYGITYEPRMQPGDERMMEKLAALSPEEFEMEFLEMFSRHHWIIIHRSIPIARDAIHDELEQMARNIVTNQYENVRKMRTWLCDWYGKCLPVPPLPPIV